MSYTIIGIKLSDRQNQAAALQEILTRYGCCIKTRIGLHDAGDGRCAPGGVVLLEVIDRQDELLGELSVKFETQSMRF